MYGNQNTKYAKQNTKCTKQNTKHAKYAISIKRVIDLRCFVAMQFLSQIYALFWCTFYRLKKIWWRTKNDKYEVCMGGKRWEEVTAPSPTVAFSNSWEIRLAVN